MTSPHAATPGEYALPADEIEALTRFRRYLHQVPELSGEERQTAMIIADEMEKAGADHVIRGLGGHGVAAIYEGAAPGPTVMFRCELDGLPITETGAVPWRSVRPGRGHLCGHDGHMAMLTGLGRLLGRARPARGRAVLLFQPAEEDGSGAAAVLSDPRFARIAPQFAFAIHNLPGLPLGAVGLTEGPVNCASRGLQIWLRGRTAHAAQPEHGVSPMPAMVALMPELVRLAEEEAARTGRLAMATVTHARMGAAAFGVAPGEAELWVTLRCLLDAQMAALDQAARALVAQQAEKHGLAAEIFVSDDFRHCENSPEAVAILRRALDGLGVAQHAAEPMRASEDFGRFGDGAKAAMLFLGAGEHRPVLHNPDYDFPDILIPRGVAIFHDVARQLLGG